MKNFNFYNPVRILFGKGKIAEIGKYIPKDKRIMLTYGGGSIMKNGVYDQVKAALKDRDIVEFGGIEPNPTYETLMKAVQRVKTENVDFLLAVGGGSVLDGTKFIAAAVYYEGDEPWEILSRMRPIRKAMPLASVITLAATGSEMNSGGVITRAETREKLSFGSPLLFPQFSVLDPQVTFSLPKRQVANGIVDAYIHVMEQYLTYPLNTPVQDRFAEGLLLTLIEEGPKAISDTEPDYNNRANLMWAATMALNGQLSLGVDSDWATHMIGHELTAYYGIDHAVTLAIVLPGVMRLLKEKRSEKMLQYAERVWNITEGSTEERIAKAISKTEAFFKSLGMGIRLSDHGVEADVIDRIIERFRMRRMTTVGNPKDINVEEVRTILEDVM
ncbi:MAG: iron-containing alcohol dehydrogenase [Lentimicrobiaceae bacterium]|nr:iron-containing alcohol dehydrogenase [Lentimicrobiaceae bacterium]